MRRKKALKVRGSFLKQTGWIGLILSTCLGSGVVLGADSVPKVGEGVHLTVSGLARFECTIGNNLNKEVYRFDKSATGTSMLAKDLGALFGVNNSRITFEMSKDLNSWTLKMPFVFTVDANSKQSVREIYVMASNDLFGSVHFGDTRGVENRLAVGPADFLSGHGIDGNALRFVNVSTLVYMAPSLVGDSGFATKLSYYTPRIAGFQVGVSVTPLTLHMGEAELNTATSPPERLFLPFDTWNVGVGVGYAQEVEGFAFRCSAVHLSGTTHPEVPNKPALDRNNTNVWDFGAVVEIGALRLGAEYLRNGVSGTALNSMMGITPLLDGVTLPAKNYEPSMINSHWAMALGIGLVNETGGITLSYFYTTRDTGIASPGETTSSKAWGRSMMLAVEYNLVPGIAPYIEGGVYKMESPDFAYVGAGFSAASGLPFTANPSNTAKAVLMGLKFKF